MGVLAKTNTCTLESQDSVLGIDRKISWLRDYFDTGHN